MPNLEEAIRERAYHLWIADGQPEGQADIYWLNAQREILTTSVESSGSNAAAPLPRCSSKRIEADRRGDRGATVHQDRLGDVILSIAFGGSAGCVRSVI